MGIAAAGRFDRRDGDAVAECFALIGHRQLSSLFCTQRSHTTSLGNVSPMSL
jgi:hypothetical protein